MSTLVCHRIQVVDLLFTCSVLGIYIQCDSTLQWSLCVRHVYRLHTNVSVLWFFSVERGEGGAVETSGQTTRPVMVADDSVSQLPRPTGNCRHCCHCEAPTGQKHSYEAYKRA